MLDPSRESTPNVSGLVIEVAQTIGLDSESQDRPLQAAGGRRTLGGMQ
jgi:hypothetical protein